MNGVLPQPTTATRPVRAPRLDDVPQVRLCLAALAVVTAVTGCHAAHTTPATGTGVALAAVVLTSPMLRARHTLALAGTGWAWVTGFLVNGGGLLTFTASDVHRALLLAAGAIVAASVPTRRARWSGRS